MIKQRTQPLFLLLSLVLLLAGCGSAGSGNPAASGPAPSPVASAGSALSEAPEAPEAPAAEAAGTPSGSPAASGAQPEPERLTLMLDWYPNAVHTFLYAAEEKGFFAEQGLEVELKMPAETNDALRLAAAGTIDLALTYQPQILMARGEQIPVKSVGAVVRHPLNHLMTLENSGITRPADLAGRTVGYSSIPLYEVMVRTMVRQDGGDPGKIALLDIGFNLVPSLSTGQADAIMGGFINHEQLLLEKEGHPVRSLNPAEYGVPDYYELVFAASDRTVETKAELLKRFMLAAAEGQQYVRDHPEEALGFLLKHEEQTSPLDPDIEQKSLEILLPLMDAGSQPFGYQDAASWDRVAEWLKQNDMLGEAGTAEEAFVNLL